MQARRRVAAIRGLLPRYRDLRERLRDGIRPADAPRFRLDVRRTLLAVERACAAAGIGPDDLPPATRNAWRAIAAIDLERLPPPRQGAGGAREAREVRIAGAAGAIERFARTCWDGLARLGQGHPDRARLEEQVRGLAGDVARAVSASRSSPARLAGAGRSLYAWASWLLLPGRLDAHLAGLRLAADAAGGFPGGRDVAVLLVPSGSLWRFNPGPRGAVLSVSEGFAAADRATWEALAGLVLSRRTGPRIEAVRRFAESPVFRDVLVAMEAFVEDEGGSRGRVHDLDAAFDRVNALCFGGAMTRPRLRWSRTPTTWLQGQYRPGTDTVALSVRLDDAAVPGHVVDYLVHHELLHRRHGAVFEGARRTVHTAGFRADERRFPRAAEAERFLEEWSRR
jgi:hypothetical protein